MGNRFPPRGRLVKLSIVARDLGLDRRTIVAMGERGELHVRYIEGTERGRWFVTRKSWERFKASLE